MNREDRRALREGPLLTNDGKRTIYATPGANAADHGPTCAETPIDHRCGDTEGDQGTTWAESSRMWSERIRAISDLHQNTKTSGGAVTGYCCECNWQWPCPTYHIAAGWGVESYHECEEAGWCKHREVPMNRREVNLILMERLSEALAKAKTTQGWCDLCQEFHTAPVCEHGFMIGHCTACLLAKRGRNASPAGRRCRGAT